MKVKVLNSQTLDEVKELNLALATRIEGECTVGRSPNAGLVIDSPDVSRLHGKFLYQNGDYYFCDLDSRNGSIVNGHLAQTNQSYKLKVGDIIRMGEFILMMEEINSIPEDLPETVYKSLDATVLSGWREAARSDVSEVVNQPQEAVNEGSDFSVIPAPEKVSELSHPDVQSVESTTDTSKVITSQEKTSVQEVTFVQPQEVAESEVIAQNLEIVSEVSEKTYIQPPEPSEEPTVPQATIATSQPAQELVVSENTNPVPEVVVSDLTATQTPEVVGVSKEMTQTPEETEDVAVLVTQEPSEESETSASAQSGDVESAVTSEQIPVNKTAKIPSIISTKYIALIAHESKRSDLEQFVTQHQEFFSQCLTLAPPSIIEILDKQLSTSMKQIPATTSGGYQTIASMVPKGDILAVIFLRDFMTPQSSQANEEALLRVCNINQVLVATNISTAEAIVHYIQLKCEIA